MQKGTNVNITDTGSGLRRYGYSIPIDQRSIYYVNPVLRESNIVVPDSYIEDEIFYEN